MSQRLKKKQGNHHTEAFKDGWLDIDPDRVRFQHSRIRPYFSGCGRGVIETLNEIRKGQISASDLPPIQVLVGIDEKDGKGPWYFSLNNRRLWVFKRCREEGLLPNNLIRVRVRKPKSSSELERYSLVNCSLDAKIMRENTVSKKVSDAGGPSTQKQSETVSDGCSSVDETGDETKDQPNTFGPLNDSSDSE